VSPNIGKANFYHSPRDRLDDVLEEIVLHALDPTAQFSEENYKRIPNLKNMWHIELDSQAGQRLRQTPSARKPIATP